MKKPSRFLRVVATLGMLAGLLAVFGASPAAAAAPDPGWTPGVAPSALIGTVAKPGAQEVYFPWVYNNDNFGLGASNGSVSIQNLTHRDGYVFFYVGNGNGWTYTTYAFLAAGASKTFSAASIGVPASGAPVVAGLYEGKESYDGSKYVCEGDYGHDINHDGDLNDCGYIAVKKSFLVPLAAGGVVKSAVAGASLPYTTSADSSVSGYNGMSGAEVYNCYFNNDWIIVGGPTDGDWEHANNPVKFTSCEGWPKNFWTAQGLYIPIVQTNVGPGGAWDTRVTVANFGVDANAGVELRFFPNNGDGSGSLQTGWQQSVLISVGAVYQITLSDYVPEGWTGNVHILSDDLIGAIADRYKVGTDMWLTNIGSLSTFEVGQFSYGPMKQYAQGGFYYPFAGQYALFAPLVYMDYNGWNTGFSVSNLVETDNNVNIQYVHNGNAIQVVTQRLAPHGMLTAYRPSQPDQDQNQQNPMYDQVAGALILSDYPVAAAVDAVKYFGNDNNVGQAMTYNATANLSLAQAFPLVQKGNPATGMGATSGLSMLNPLPIQNSIKVLWLNQSGYNASNFGISTLIVPAQSIGIAYTMTQHNLPNGYYGSAVAHANLPFVAVTANVDYQVTGDGSVVWNGYNPCGLFRSIDYTGDETLFCVFGITAPPNPPRTFLDVRVEGLPVGATGADIYVFNNECTNPPQTIADADSWAYDVPNETSVTFDGVPGPFCVGVDFDRNGTIDAWFPGTLPAGDPAGDVDVVVAPRGTTILDVVVEGLPSDSPGADLYVYYGGCPTTTPLPTADASLTGVPNDGTAQFVVPAGKYCVGADFDGDGTIDKWYEGTIPDGDPGGDVDLVVSPLTTILDVLVTGLPGTTTADVYVFHGACPTPRPAPGSADAVALGVANNGTPQFTVPSGDFCVGVDFDGDGTIDEWYTSTIPYGDPAGDVDLTVSPPDTFLDVQLQNMPSSMASTTVYAFWGDCQAPLLVANADASVAGVAYNGTAHFPAGPYGDFCVGIDFNNDGTIDFWTFGTLPVGDPTGDVDAIIDGQKTILDVKVQGLPVGHAGVNIYVFHGACETPLPTAADADAQQLLVQDGATAHFGVPPGPFCVGVDIDNDGVIDQWYEDTIPAGDPPDDVDVLVSTMPAVLDVRIENLPSPLTSVDVYIYEGGCVAPLNTADADQVVTGVANGGSASTTIPAGNYCAGIDTDGDGTIDRWVSGVLPPGDPSGDVDAIIDGQRTVLTIMVKSLSGASPYDGKADVYVFFQGCTSPSLSLASADIKQMGMVDAQRVHLDVSPGTYCLGFDYDHDGFAELWYQGTITQGAGVNSTGILFGFLTGPTYFADYFAPLPGA